MLLELNPREFHPIGTTGTYANINFKVMPSDTSNCSQCAFNHLNCVGFSCLPYRRRDRMGVIFKRIE